MAPTEDHIRHLEHAVALAQRAVESGDGGPFGAVVVQGDEVIAEGWNKVIATNDPTAHAEITAIRAACSALGTFQLPGATIYASCEPCPMCLGAIFWARPAAVYFTATRAHAEQVGFDDSEIYDQVGLEHTERSLPFHQLEVAGATEVFELWRTWPGRTHY